MIKMNSDLGLTRDREQACVANSGNQVSGDRQCHSTKSLDMLQRDRFETISAYLDGEVDAGERQQVEHWLNTDPSAQKLYQRLLNLRKGLQRFQVEPVTELVPEESTQAIADRVFKRVNRQAKLVDFWRTGLAAAAVLGAVFSTGLLDFTSSVPQTAQSPSAVPGPVTEELPVTVALDSPVIEALQSSETVAD